MWWKRFLKDALPIGDTAFVEDIGPSYDRIPFNADDRVELYEFVLVPNEEKRVLHYGRIVSGIEQNFEATPQRLRTRKAYSFDLPSRRQDSPDLSKVQFVEVLGELTESSPGHIERLDPMSLPETGRPVYRLPVDLYPEVLGTPDDGLRVGDMALGVRGQFILPLTSLPRHIGVFGRPGTGKSYAAAVLAEEVRRLGIPQINIDVNGEMVAAAHEFGGVTLEPGRDFRIPLAHLDVSELLAILPRLTEVQEDMVVSAFLTLAEEDRDFTVEDLKGRILELGREFQSQKGADARSALKVNRLRKDPLIWDVGVAQVRGSTVATPADWAKLLLDRQFVNIYVGGLRQRRREIVVAVTCRMLQSLRSRNEIPPFVFSLDEAHRFVPSGGADSPSTEVIRDFIRMGRHLTIGNVLISQSPSSIDRQILLLLNTRVLFALDGEDQRAMSGFLADAPKELIDRIPTLRQGTAVVAAGSDILRHTMFVRFRKRQTTDGAQTPNLVEEVRKWKENGRIS